jgi:NADPH:quinone reductase-like Zn-dependent oxidoreductase
MKVLEVRDPYGCDALQLVERAEPGKPGAGQILIRVRAVALNYRDLLVAKGIDRWRPPSGRVPASDAVGIVEAVGSAVRRVEVGQRVALAFLPRWIDGPLTASKLAGALGGATADGVLREFLLVDAESVVAVPDYLTDVEAATLPCAALTAWHAVSRAGTLDPKKTLLVQGTGGVSLFALQFAKAAGASVIATSKSDDKLELIVKLGAASGINYRRHPDWDRAVLDLTASIGVDHVLDIGGADTINRSVGAVRYEGVVSIIGLLGGLNATVDIGPIFIKNIRIDGVETGSREMLESMSAFMAKHRIRPVIDRVFALADAPAAFRYLDGGTHVGKVCIGL